MKKVNNQMIFDAFLAENNVLLRDVMSLSELEEEVNNTFYDHEGNECTFNHLRKFNNGSCGNVYFLDEAQDVVFKKYFLLTLSNLRLKYEIFDMLREIAHPNTITTIDDYYASREDALMRRDMAGYTYNFVKEEKIDVLKTSKDYFLENLSALEKLFDLLAQNEVAVSDLKTDNTILNRERIVIIDPDCFEQLRGVSIKYITRVNKRALLCLMRDILYAKSDAQVYLKKNVGSLLSLELEDEKDMTSVVAKRLLLKKRVIDYMK